MQSFVYCSMPTIKSIEFLGNSLDELCSFPASAKRRAGFQLDKVQRGMEPDDWKMMTSIGRGVREIRLHDPNGEFRIIYVAKFAHAIYVLHCFQKKTQKTVKADLDLVAKRYKDLIQELKP